MLFLQKYKHMSDCIVKVGTFGDTHTHTHTHTHTAVVQCMQW